MAPGCKGNRGWPWGLGLVSYFIPSWHRNVLKVGYPFPAESFVGNVRRGQRGVGRWSCWLLGARFSFHFCGPIWNEALGGMFASPHLPARQITPPSGVRNFTYNEAYKQGEKFSNTLGFNLKSVKERRFWRRFCSFFLAMLPRSTLALGIKWLLAARICATWWTLKPVVGAGLSWHPGKNWSLWRGFSGCSLASQQKRNVTETKGIRLVSFQLISVLYFSPGVSCLSWLLH